MSVWMSEEILSHWKLGVDQFNRGEFWNAHESWENGWVSLPEIYRLHIQALIQVAAVFHLLALGREDPALRLCASCIPKLQERPADGPWVEIQGAKAALLEIQRKPARFREIQSTLFAELVK